MSPLPRALAAALALTAPLFLCLPSAAHPPEAQREFGDALLRDGDAYRAIGAYKGALFSAPDAPWAELVRYRIAVAYLVGGQPEAAMAEASRLSGELGPLRLDAELLSARAAYAAESDRDLRLGLGAIEDELAGARLAYARYLWGWSRLRAWDFEGAAARFKEVPAGSPWSADAQALTEALGAGPAFSRKSPTLAALLSVIPGLGHLYLGMYGVALSALVWNGAFIYAMWESAQAQQWGLLALLGVLESIWYGGTVFGAVAGAHRHNRDATLNQIDLWRQSHPPPGLPPEPPSGDAPPLGLELRGRF